MILSRYISFRKLRGTDLKLMHTWLHQPHVREWYEESTLKEVCRDYGKIIRHKDPIEGYIVLYKKKRVGYIQVCKINDWPAFVKTVGYDESAASVDVFIGEPAFVGIGLGNLMIKKFLKNVVFAEPGITTCFIDPKPANKRAIRSYEKVGFRYVQTVQFPDEPVPAYLMEIRKKDMIVRRSGKIIHHFFRLEHAVRSFHL